MKTPFAVLVADYSWKNTVPGCVKIVTEAKAEYDALNAVAKACSDLLLTGEYRTPEGTIENLFPKRFNATKQAIAQLDAVRNNSKPRAKEFQ